MQIGDHATELAEILAEILDRLAVQEERAAAREAAYEQRISSLEERAASNRTLICECERFIKASGAMWTTMATEAGRISSAQQAPD